MKKSQRSIPFFEYPRLYLDDKEKLISIFDEVSSKGAFILQKDVDQFEKDLAKYTGAKYVSAVNSATSGFKYQTR